MKLNLKSFFAGILVMLIISGGSMVFGETNLAINATFGKVKLIVNGLPANRETLLYNNTTYVPLRDAAEILGMEVGWNSSTNTASLTNTAGSSNMDSESLRKTVAQAAFTPGASGFYAMYPAVPDFGAVIGHGPVAIRDHNFGVFSYTYVVNDGMDEALNKWISKLEEAGFEPEEGSTLIGNCSYKKDSSLANMRLLEDKLFVEITVMDWR